MLATQRLLMATPAKRALDFDGTQSPGNGKKMPVPYMGSTSKIDDAQETSEESQDSASLCKATNASFEILSQALILM